MPSKVPRGGENDWHGQSPGQAQAGARGPGSPGCYISTPVPRGSASHVQGETPARPHLPQGQLWATHPCPSTPAPPLPEVTGRQAQGRTPEGSPPCRPVSDPGGAGPTAATVSAAQLRGGFTRTGPPPRLRQALEGPTPATDHS